MSQNNFLNKKYEIRLSIEYGVNYHVMTSLLKLYIKQNHDTENDPALQCCILQKAVHTMEVSSIEVVLDETLDCEKFEVQLKELTDILYHHQVSEVIEVIKEASIDKRNTIHIYQN